MSAKEYIRTPEMMGMKSFRCRNCNALMIRHFMSHSFEMGLECRCCKTKEYIQCKESIPATKELDRDTYDQDLIDMKDKVQSIDIAKAQMEK